ncbi:MAG: cellulase family glycosylhydrolase [Actinomycetota bacterium]|nr:cellulase family glycosylhydrolase [Actinomycetota bacterium]MDQ5807843.1 cellulase family glycosylhydrolase [Actinomycetota bacterium]
MALRPLLLATLVAVLLLGATAPAHAARTQPLYFDAPELRNPEVREGTLDELQSLGVRAVRVVLYWQDVAPDAERNNRPDVDLTDPAAYNWATYEEAIGAAHARGMRVLLTLTTPGPRWAMRDRSDRVTRPSPAEFRKFVVAAGRRYGDRVDAWAALNEPNHPDFLGPQYAKSGRPLSPRIYRALFQAMDSGLEDSGNAGDTLLMGETAPRGTGKVVHPITFMRLSLCLNAKWRRSSSCGRLDADGWAHHPYTTKVGPWFEPPSPNDVTIGVLPRLTRALDRATRAGAFRRTSKMPVWLTEFGIQSTPDRYFGVSLTKQLEYRAIAERMAWSNPRVRAFSQYLLRDDQPVEGESGRSRYGGFESGLRFSTGREKPALSAFRLSLAALRSGSRVSLWGLVRPARGRVDATVLYGDKGSKTFRTLKRVRTDARGYFTLRTRFKKGRRYRLKWEDAQGYPVRVYKRR